MDVTLYDTTLRDGTQREGLSLSAEDKVKIARRLDALGVSYIEGGWPGSNPKDAEFFRRMERVPLRQAKLAAFGMTRRAGSRCADDANCRALVDAGTPVVTLVGKSSTLHVDRVLRTSRDENLRMIAETVAHVQGTINGYGERCGNLDLISLIATLQLKLEYRVLPPEQLRHLSDLARFVAAVGNLTPDPYAPYVGRSAFAHKGGIHVAAVAELPQSYQHIDPGLVGNEMRVVVSELAGRRNVRLRAEALGIATNDRDADVLQRIKQLEHGGYQFEAAEGSFAMLLRRAAPGYEPPFEMRDFTVIVASHAGSPVTARASVTLRVGGAEIGAAADGAGPVNALDRAVREALLPHYPELADVHLVDYRVRIVDEHLGTAAKPRVVIESARGAERWSTVGCSENIIEASWQALRDALELALWRRG